MNPKKQNPRRGDHWQAWWSASTGRQLEVPTSDLTVTPIRYNINLRRFESTRILHAGATANEPVALGAQPLINSIVLEKFQSNRWAAASSLSQQYTPGVSHFFIMGGSSWSSFWDDQWHVMHWRVMRPGHHSYSDMVTFKMVAITNVQFEMYP